MIARHTLTVTAICPVDGRPDRYDAEVTTSRTLPVEDILAAVQGLAGERMYQEDLTVNLARRLGAQVKTTGHHSGIKTEVWA